MEPDLEKGPVFYFCLTIIKSESCNFASVKKYILPLYRKWIAMSGIAVIALTSCEKNIDFNLDAAEPTLVVDARIENDEPPVVILSRSLGYFGEISIDSLAASFVRDAEVYISNGTLTHKLKEYAIPLSAGYQAYYYSIDSSDLATAFEGAFNTTYQLRIVTNGKEYTSTTSIPTPAVAPDSIWFERAPQNPDTLKRVFKIRVSDPPGLGNRIRYFTKKNNEPFYPGESSVWDDQVLDGTTYTVILPPGINRNNPPEDDDNFFVKGDTVTLKFANIDRGTFNFWETWEFAYTSIGNPFAQPNVVINNISNGGLGAFCGYASLFYTIIAD